MTSRFLAIATVVLALVAGWTCRLARAEAGHLPTGSPGAHGRDPARIDRPHTPDPAGCPARDEIAWEADEEDEHGPSVSFDLLADGPGPGPARAEVLPGRMAHADGGAAGRRAPIRCPLRC